VGLTESGNPLANTGFGGCWCALHENGVDPMVVEGETLFVVRQLLVMHNLCTQIRMPTVPKRQPSGLKRSRMHMRF
jgi:hypothetical protein